MSTIFCQYSIPTNVGYDNLFQTGILCSKKAVHLLQHRCRCIPQASLVSTLVQSIPNWNTLFKKGCASAAAKMSPHSTGIASCQYPRIIHPSWGTIFVCRPYFMLFFVHYEGCSWTNQKHRTTPPTTTTPPYPCCRQLAATTDATLPSRRRRRLPSDRRSESLSLNIN